MKIWNLLTQLPHSLKFKMDSKLNIYTNSQLEIKALAASY